MRRAPRRWPACPGWLVEVGACSMQGGARTRSLFVICRFELQKPQQWKICSQSLHLLTALRAGPPFCWGVTIGAAQRAVPFKEGSSQAIGQQHTSLLRAGCR